MLSAFFPPAPNRANPTRRPHSPSRLLPHPKSPPPNISLAPINFDPINTSLILNQCAVLMVDNAKLKSENEKLDAENVSIKFHNTQISYALEDLEPKVHHLKQERRRNKERIAGKEDRIKSLLAVLEGKKVRVGRKEDENRELRRVMVRMGKTIDRLEAENRVLEEEKERREYRQFDREDNVKSWRDRAKVLAREVERLKKREEKIMKEWRGNDASRLSENSPEGSFSLSRPSSPSPPSSSESASPSSSKAGSPPPTKPCDSPIETNDSGIVMSDDKKTLKVWKQRAIASDSSSSSPSSFKSASPPATKPSNESNDSRISMHYSYYDLDRTSQEKMERSYASSSSPASAKVSRGPVTAIDMDTFLQDFNQGLVFPEDGPLDARSEALLTALDLSGGAEDTWDGIIKGEEFDPPLIPALVNISGPMVGSRPFDAGTSTAGPVDSWAGIPRDYIEPLMETMMPTPLDVSGPAAEGLLVDAKVSMMPAPLNIPSPVPDLDQAHPIGRFGTLPTSLVEWAALNGVQLPRLAHGTSDEVIAECMAQKARLVAIATARGAPGGEFISAMEMGDDEVCDRIKESRGLNAGVMNGEGGILTSPESKLILGPVSDLKSLTQDQQRR